MSSRETHVFKKANKLKQLYLSQTTQNINTGIVEITRLYNYIFYIKVASDYYLYLILV